MPPPLRICHIIFRLEVGGLENGLVNLINKLPSEQFEHSIICLTQSSNFASRIRRPGVRIFEVHKRPGKDLGAYPKVWRLLRQISPDIVHTRNLPALDMLLPARIAGVRCLIHGEHGLDMLEMHGQHSRYNRLRKLSRLLVSRYIAVSADLAKWLHSEIGIPNERIELVYNGVDTDLFRPGPPSNALPQGFSRAGGLIIGTLGRLEPVKDQLTLAKAFCQALTHRPDLKERARLVIVGDGVLRPQIEQVLRSSGMDKLAWLPGFREDAAELYRSLNLFVLPSRREGISNTLLEAMASGLPVIATAVGGTPEILVNNVTGTLIPPDDVERMSAAIIHYADNPALMVEHGNAGRLRVVENFSLEQMVQSYARIYESLRIKS